MDLPHEIIKLIALFGTPKDVGNIGIGSKTLVPIFHDWPFWELKAQNDFWVTTQLFYQSIDGLTPYQAYVKAGALSGHPISGALRYASYKIMISQILEEDHPNPEIMYEYIEVILNLTNITEINEAWDYVVNCEFIEQLQVDNVLTIIETLKQKYPNFGEDIMDVGIGLAARRGDINAFNKLIVDSKISKISVYLKDAIIGGNDNIIQQVMKSANNFDRSALKAAIIKNDYTLVEKLLSCVYKTNYRFAMRTAAKTGNYEIFDLLVAAGGTSYSAAAAAAASAGNYDMLMYIISTSGVHHINYYHIFEDIGKSGDANLLEIMLQKGFLDEKSAKNSALRGAATAGKLSIIKYIYPTDNDILDEILTSTIQFGQDYHTYDAIDVVRYLVSIGAVFTEDHLIEFTYCTDMEFFLHHYQQLDDPSPDLFLSQAIYNNNLDLVKYFIATYGKVPLYDIKQIKKSPNLRHIYSTYK